MMFVCGSSTFGLGLHLVQAFLQGCTLDLIIESFRLEKTLKVIELNCKPKTAKSTMSLKPHVYMSFK